MSSPPANTSPYQSSLNVPRKRPSIHTSDSTSNKRRKPSTVSAISSGHPLRQTSFPPPENAFVSRQFSFSPPASATPRSSLAGGEGRGRGRGRGGRRKAADARSTADTSDAARTASKTGEAKKAYTVTGEDADDYDEEEEEEGEQAQDIMLEAGGGATNEAQSKMEHEHMKMLIGAFSAEQMNRYEMWRRVKLSKPVVRRLVNQTLSQSVPQSIVTVVNGYTKLFAGELIDRARDVQAEWLASAPTLPNGEANPNFPGSEKVADSVEGNDEIENATTKDGKDGGRKEVDGQNPQNKTRKVDVKEIDKGPLTPEHLREALRRYKLDRDGGGVGTQGLSLYGAANTASRAGGKRLFR